MVYCGWFWVLALDSFWRCIKDLAYFGWVVFGVEHVAMKYVLAIIVMSK